MNKRIQSVFLAAGLSGLAALAPDARAASHGDRDTYAPRAFGSFCAREPEQCAIQGVPGSTVSMDGGRWSQLRSVNLHVNRSIRSVDDRVSSGAADVWSVVGAGEAGDCEDYALTKRSMLIARGWPSSSLLVSVVRTSSGEGHAVLIARTSEGHFVLDNRTSAIRKATHTGYRFYMMQSPDNPRSWVAVPRSGPVDEIGRVRIAGAGTAIVATAPAPRPRAVRSANPVSARKFRPSWPGATFAFGSARTLNVSELPFAAGRDVRRIRRD